MSIGAINALAYTTQTIPPLALAAIIFFIIGIILYKINSDKPHSFTSHGKTKRSPSAARVPKVPKAKRSLGA